MFNKLLSLFRKKKLSALQIEHCNTLIEALRSGKYNHIYNVLHVNDGNNSFCVMGLACELSGLGYWEPWTQREKTINNHSIVSNISPDGEFMKYTPWYETTLRPDASLCFTGPECILDHYGFTKDFRETLMMINDLCDNSSMCFSRIADELEEYVEKNS